MYDMLTEEDMANPGIAEDIDTILRFIWKGITDGHCGDLHNTANSFFIKHARYIFKRE